MPHSPSLLNTYFTVDVRLVEVTGYFIQSLHAEPPIVHQMDKIRLLPHASQFIALILGLLTPEYGTDWLSRNVLNDLTLHAAS